MNTSVPSLDLKNVFANNLKNLLKEHNLSRKALCEILEIKYTTFCDWINARTIPKEAQLEKLCQYFDITVGDLLIEPHTMIDSPISRLNAYAAKTRELKMSILEELDDNQIIDLLQAGFTFKHKSFEQYVEESGKPFDNSTSLDWGTPMGDERW